MSKSYNHNQRDRRDQLERKTRASRKIERVRSREHDAKVELKNWQHRPTFA